ncbi:hypothetical protein P4O66_001473 [Electrophorus voltai]|uniref:CDP-diacylglycerol--glycerol-3-phosphate 3-phosphatidyltransferase n=1 Tax=Electrophorus voltai TaxID=2609070 RepID=A0AAD8Z6Y7_9TELE|nr:hypothetical protein P4O66_001473 [Electrophorus voltai]
MLSIVQRLLLTEALWANLSESYFTNRQDRYVLVEDCAEVANFFAELVHAVSDISLQLEHDDTVHVMEEMRLRGPGVAGLQPVGKAPVFAIKAQLVLLHTYLWVFFPSLDSKQTSDQPLPHHSHHILLVECTTKLAPDQEVLPRRQALTERFPDGNRVDFSSSAHQRIMGVISVARARQQLLELGHLRDSDSEFEGGEEHSDTWLFPLVQMKPLGIQLDEEVTQRLLMEAGKDATVYLTSGYFNLTQAYMRLVLGAASDYCILMASPEVNGFFGAKGVAGAIPEAYVHLAHQFYSKVCKLGQQGRVQLHEYHRPDWTFHAKGLWYYLKGKDGPCFTLIGSPNFGYRSVHRDLEAQIALVTENEQLQAQLHQEQEMLYQRSTEVSNSTFKQPDRYVKLWVKLITPLIKNFF